MITICIDGIKRIQVKYINKLSLDLSSDLNTLFKFELKSAKTKADFREAELVQGFGLSFLEQMKIIIIEPKSKQGYWRIIAKQGPEILERYRIEKCESIQWIVGNILKKQNNGN